jgi:hypothetical protein
VSLGTCRPQASIAVRYDNEALAAVALQRQAGVASTEAIVAIACLPPRGIPSLAPLSLAPRPGVDQSSNTISPRTSVSVAMSYPVIKLVRRTPIEENVRRAVTSPG